jgi:hypothetical protein
MHFRNIARVAAVCLALAACESSTGSTPVEGTYTLYSVEGRLLPVTVDSVRWADGTAYTVDRLLASSVEILSADSARYTLSERKVTYIAPGDSVYSGRCISMPVPYRVQGDRLLLIIEPALWGQPGPLRLDSLQIGDESLVRNIRGVSGAPLRLEYAASAQPARCQGLFP